MILENFSIEESHEIMLRDKHFVYPLRKIKNYIKIQLIKIEQSNREDMRKSTRRG